MTRVPGRMAYDLAMRDSTSKYPMRGDGNRLLPRCAPAFRPGFEIRDDDAIFTIGSCFARNIEDKLLRLGYRVPCLDFEIPEDEMWPGRPTSGALNKYSPFSMLNELHFAMNTSKALAPEAYLIPGAPGDYMDYQMHTRRPVTLERGLERRAQVKSLYQSGLSESRVVVITLGMTEAWFDNDVGIYINDTPSFNMVRKYSDRFSFEVVPFEKVLECVKEALDLLYDFRDGDINVVLTVSPVPLQRTFTGEDVIVANCNSKSTLRAVAGEVCRSFDFVEYFPSYESVIYSDPTVTWNDDQVHVTKPAVDYIIDRMVGRYSSREEIAAAT